MMISHVSPLLILIAGTWIFHKTGTLQPKNKQGIRLTPSKRHFPAISLILLISMELISGLRIICCYDLTWKEDCLSRQILVPDPFRRQTPPGLYLYRVIMLGPA